MELEGFTHRSRHGVVFEVQESISSCGGAILDHQQFSNHLLRLSIEVPITRLDELLAGIESAGVSLSQASLDESRAKAENQARKAPVGRIGGTLVIRFVSDEPDLRVPVPSIPG